MNTINKSPYRKLTQDPALNPRKSIDKGSGLGLRNLESPMKSVYYDFDSIRVDSAGKENMLRLASPGAPIDDVEDPEHDVVMEKGMEQHKCCGGCNMF